MTKRAILWCGHVERPRFRRDEFGRLTESSDDPAKAADDFKIQANGLELAFSAACALGVSPRDIHACLVDEDLKPRELLTGPHRATVADLRRLTGTMKADARPGDPLLFIAVNHGEQGGLLTAEPVPLDEFEEAAPSAPLTPAILDECLGPLTGPQVIIIAACYAGAFLPMGEGRVDRVVLASCSLEKYHVRREGCAWSAFLDELFGAWCSSALSDAVPTQRLLLDQAFEHAYKRLASEKENAADPEKIQLPRRAGLVSWPD